LAIGGSGSDTGGLIRVLAGLSDLPGMVVVVALQHRELLDEEGFRRALGSHAGALAPVADGVPLELGRVYLNPPDMVVTLDQDRLRTRPADGGPGARAIIDSLFLSVAGDEDGNAIGLMLAGTGGEGTLGVAALKEAGGFTLAEAE
jgi:two-component system CheB/CheR fusion protein